MVIWRISDDKPGHDHQSQGLIKAIDRLVSVECHEIHATGFSPGFLDFILNKFPDGDNLPKPDLIVGAGHGTHLSVLCAQRAHGGKTAILMKPGLPASLFDYCLIPEHDNPVEANNIIVTRGAINLMTPSTQHDNKLGLMMIGGPSRHYGWDNHEIISQIEMVAQKTPDVFWHITDSPRTPDITRDALNKLNMENITFQSFKHSHGDWLAHQLQKCGYAWVTTDSISMTYESLTAGCATGIFQVPEKRKNKISRSIEMLKKDKFITLYTDWLYGKPLLAPAVALNEANRCANELLRMLHDRN